MAYNVISGEIQSGVLYLVAGAQSVTYNTVTYTTGQHFRGVAGVSNFTYSGAGAQEVNEVLELTGGTTGFLTNSVDEPVYPETTILTGMSIELALTDEEKAVNDITKIQGFAVELIDYPFYSFQITETKL